MLYLNISLDSLVIFMLTLVDDAGPRAKNLLLPVGQSSHVSNVNIDAP